MTIEEKQKAIYVLKNSAPVMPLKKQEEFNDYVQVINQVIDWLEQEPILDKIRAEIEKTKTTMNIFNREDTKQYAIAMEDVLKIIDKYKTESEGVRNV